MSRYGTDLHRLWDDDVEHCGFFLHDGRVIHVPNIHEDPKEGFRIAYSEMRKYEPQIKATWHTHPKTGANLSVQDYFLFSRYPQWEHVIIAQYAFRIYQAIGARVIIREDDSV